ncbi:MAG: hypothetical protein F6K16_09865 [Symploca sp. SIO2B6]|nr:hypothetical protein [Symploca sp. SIO2B6]
MSSSAKDSARERLELMRKLNSIPLQQFDMILFTLDVPNNIISPNSAPQANRTNELVRWAKGAEGCGLLYLWQVLDSVVNEQPLPERQDMTVQEVEIKKENTLLFVSARGVYKTFRVLDSLGWYELPTTSPEITKRVSKKVAQDFQYAREWKEIHAIAEELYSKYIKLYRYMCLCQLASELQSIEQADIQRSMATNYFKDVIELRSKSILEDLRQLSSIFRTAPVTVLRNLPRCLPAITQSLGSPSQSSTFYNGILLVERICELVLDALHIADNLLMLHFDNLKQVS